MSARSEAEERFIEAWEDGGVESPKREYRFHPARRWRFDFCWPDVKLAVEIEGRGRHQTVVGYRGDCEKYNEATRLGWRVLRFPATDCKPSKGRAQWPRGAADWAELVLEVLCDVKDEDDAVR